MIHYTFTTSDIIQFLGIIASLITSIIAIAISVKTLKQNSKMIEESTRPYIQIYPIYLNSYVYINIKNFGQSYGIIDSVSCNHKFTKEQTLNDDLGQNIFDIVSGAILAPGHSITCPLTAHKVSSIKFEFVIKYHSSSKSYEDHFSFNPHANSPFADLYPSGKTETDHLKNISKELRDLVKLQL